MSNSLRNRLAYLGGDRMGRIVEGKRRSFLASLGNDYNTRLIETPRGEAVHCLINNNLLKPDYDRKIVSVSHDAMLQAGDVFRCLDDNSRWMVYLPDLAELAYLHSEIIRCRYSLEIEGKEYWIYFQGPTQTTIQWYQKNSIEFNEPNYSGTIYIQNTPVTANYFHRFTKIKIADQTWEVQVVDRTTVPGIIELEIKEYYNNSIEELPQIIEQEPIHQIIGQVLVPQDSEIGYTIDQALFDDDWTWSIVGNDRVRIVNVDKTGRICKVKVHQGAIGDFIIRCGNRNSGYQLTVHIDTDWTKINGPEEVKPYSIVEYSNPTTGRFWIEKTKVAKIISQDGLSCKVEIVASKKDSFTLGFTENETGAIKKLEVKVLSL